MKRNMPLRASLAPWLSELFLEPKRASTSERARGLRARAYARPGPTFNSGTNISCLMAPCLSTLRLRTYVRSDVRTYVDGHCDRTYVRFRACDVRTYVRLRQVSCLRRTYVRTSRGAYVRSQCRAERTYVRTYVRSARHCDRTYAPRDVRTYVRRKHETWRNRTYVRTSQARNRTYVRSQCPSTYVRTSERTYVRSLSVERHGAIRQEMFVPELNVGPGRAYARARKPRARSLVEARFGSRNNSESQGAREARRGMFLFIISAWSLLCVILGMYAGCWCTRRAHKSSTSSMTEDEAQDSETEATATAATATASAAKRPNSQTPCFKTIKTMPKCRMYHTDAPVTMLHSRPDCKGLLSRRNQLVCRQMCSLCCGNNDLIIAR